MVMAAECDRPTGTKRSAAVFWLAIMCGTARTLSTRTVKTRGEGSSQKCTHESDAEHGECL